MTDPELAAAQAYVRLLQTTRAVLADPEQSDVALPLLSAPIAEADEALRALGLSGNEAEFFRLISRRLPGSSPKCPGTATADFGVQPPARRTDLLQ